MIWEPFLLALVLGIIVSAGLYFAYLWPSVEPVDEEPAPAAEETAAAADASPSSSRPPGEPAPDEAAAT